jgi:excisionase family DNA binding protein
MDTTDLLDQLAERGIVALVPQQPPTAHRQAGSPALATRRWYSVREVADMLGYGLSKTKMLVTTGQLRSIKDGKYRRILPEWVDEYINRRVREQATT